MITQKSHFLGEYNLEKLNTKKNEFDWRHNRPTNKYYLTATSNPDLVKVGTQKPSKCSGCSRRKLLMEK